MKRTSRADSVTVRWTRGEVTAAVFALVAAVTGGCEQAAPEPVVTVRPVRMLQLGNGATPLEYPGRLAATTSARIAFEVSGRITDFPVVQGQFVRQGELLAQLDPRDYQAMLDAVRAERNVARAEYERSQGLYTSGATSRQQLEDAQLRFEVAESLIRRAEKAVADTRLVAEFSGQVARKLARAFESVDARQPILVLQNIQPTLDVIVNVAEREVGLRIVSGPGEAFAEIANRAGVTAEFMADPGRRYALRPKEFASQADPVTRTFALTFSFDPPDDLRLLPGMTARVFATPSGETGGLKVPSNALGWDERGDPFVWVVEPSTMTVYSRFVEIGEGSGEEVVLTGGVTSGETVVVSGVRTLQEGTEVATIQY